MSVLKEDLNIYVHKRISENQGEYDVESLKADKYGVYENDEKQEEKTIIDILPNITKNDYIDKIEIISGKLEYVSEDNMKEYSWAKEAFEGVTADFDKSTSNKEKNNLQVDNASESENLKIYGNSVQNGTPSTDNPIEIQSVGDKTNNIIDFSKCTWTKMNGNNCNYEFDNNTFTIERTLENYVAGVSSNIELQAGTYNISISNISGNTTYSNGEYFIYFMDSSIVVKKSNGFKKSFTLTEDSVVKIYLPDRTDQKIGNKIKYNIQLEKWKDATAYEPYGYYKIPVTVSGKNLIPYPYVSEYN